MKAKQSSQKEKASFDIPPRELSKREKEVVQFVAKGYRNKEVAEKMGISVNTVESHRANIMNKLAIRNLAELIRYAIQKGYISLKTHVGLFPIYLFLEEGVPFI